MRQIIGLVSESGSSGVKFRDTGWQLVIHFTAWRYADDTLQCGKLRCVFPMSSKDAMREQMAQIAPYQILEVVGEEGESAIELSAITSYNVTDSELTTIAIERQKPIIFHDERLGEFIYNRRLGWYEGSAEWNGKRIKLSLGCEDPEAYHAELATAHQLFAEQPQWQARVNGYAVEMLLSSKNDYWIDEDEETVTAEEFIGRMTLTSLTIEAGGEFDFWHDDGDLFYGHAIQISGNLQNGLTDANTPG